MKVEKIVTLLLVLALLVGTSGCISLVSNGTLDPSNDKELELLFVAFILEVAFWPVLVADVLIASGVFDREEAPAHEPSREEEPSEGPEEEG